MLITSLKTYSAASVLEVMKGAENYNRYLGRLIDIHLQAHFRMLDFGTGAGSFALPLWRRGRRYLCRTRCSAWRAS